MAGTTAEDRSATTLLTVDEAEMRVGAFMPPSRPGVPWALARTDLSGPVFDAARERMLARGYATAEPWAGDAIPGALRPAGAWSAFVEHAAHFTGIAPHLTISTPDATTGVRLIPGLLPRRGLRRPRVLTAEHLRVPTGAGDEPLPVRIDEGPPGAMLDALVRAAFAAATGSLTLRHPGGTDTVQFGPEGPRVADGASSVPITAEQCSAVFQRVVLARFADVH